MTEKKNIILDATTLSSLMSCGRLTDLHYNHNLRSVNGKSNSLECGSIVHKVIEVYNKKLIEGMKRHDAIDKGMNAGQLYIDGCPTCAGFKETDSRPSCGHEVDEYPGVQNTPELSEPKSFKIGWKWVLETCVQYFDHYRNDSWVPLFVEEVKGDILYEDDVVRVLWKAKFDLGVDTNQGIFPVDHKTMKQRRDSNSLNNQFMGQCILMKTRNIIIDKIGFQTTLKPDEKFIRAVVSYSADRLIEWQSEILPYWAYQMLEYTESGYWPPNFTHCENKYGNCIHIGTCSSDRNMREEELKLHFIVGTKWNPMNLETPLSED